jgi:small subunit ribosomal protein S18e
MSLVLEADSFTHILRIMSTNVDGKRKVLLPFIPHPSSFLLRAHCTHPAASRRMQVPFALTAIRGLGRRFTTLACKKAGVNVHKR